MIRLIGLVLIHCSLNIPILRVFKTVFIAPEMILIDVVDNFVNAITAHFIQKYDYRLNDIVDQSLLTLHRNNYQFNKSIDLIKSMMWPSFGIYEWRQKDIEQYEKCVRIYGHDLVSIHKHVTPHFLNTNLLDRYR